MPPERLEGEEAISRFSNNSSFPKAYQWIDSTGMNSNKAAFAMGIGGVLLLIWMSLGIGIIGEDGNPANVVYGSVVAIGALGFFISRRKPAGMALTLFTMAAAQAVITLVAIIGEAGMPWSGPAELLGLNGIFIVLFTAAGLMFRKSAGKVKSE
jgi:hypothetical protein